ncbi:LOW QUALITY PROTEIN: cohesin subunit SA-2 [Aplochiton taeniatus]
MTPDKESSFDSLEEMDDMSDSGSDFEVELKAMKRKKKTSAGLGLGLSKKPRHNAEASVTSRSNSTPPKTRRSSPRTLRRGIQNKQGISAGDMYEAIRSGKSAMVALVDEWLDSYKQDREAGLLVLINFIVRSCGCKGVVTKDMFDHMQNAEIIGTLTKEFNEESVNYPLCSPGIQWKRFKAGLCEFVRVLVHSCQNSLLYDEYLFSSLLALLTGLSDSQVRAFRHTSTLLAMKLMTGVVEVAVTVFAQMKTTQRRYDVERSKKAEDKAMQRLEELQATIKELHEHQEELSCIMNAGFRGVFVHRYRDRVPEIRSVCIEELGVWLRENPVDFLNDGYLKYLGWTLNDKQGSVRLWCVRALQGLYQEKDFIGRLELFTSRFKGRMLSMVLDKDPDVAVEAVQLLLLIQQKTEDGLTEEERSQVYPLVFASHRALAAAAGAFLYQMLSSAMAGDRQEAEKDGASHRADFLNILVSFFIQSEFHEHGAYLVDSLWAVAGSELRDWDTMTALLLQEPGHGEGLSDEEEGALIELMVCAVRQAGEGHPPVGRAVGKKILSMKDKKTQAQDRRRITNHFITLLPQLLAKYSADVEKVKLLLKVPLHFDLEAYGSARRLEKYLDLLLSQVCGIVEKHTEASVLGACASLATALCADHYAFSSRADLAFSQLLDGLAERFGAHLNELLKGTADEDDAYNAAMALKRIAAFSGAKDLRGWKLFNPCVQLLKSGVETTDLDKELMVPALKCAAFHVLWGKVKAASSAPTEVELKLLKKEVHSFCTVCQRCLTVGQTETRDQAFELLCDLLLLYSVGSVRSQPALHTLAHPPSDSLRSEMAAFVLDYVFAEPEEDKLSEDEEEAEEKLASLQQRRNQLAGYCKLVIYGVLDLSSATDVFKFYSKFYKDYGDIIKYTLSKTKLISPVQSAKTVGLCLQQLFSALATEERGSQELTEIRELAKKLAMSFGIDLHRVRKPLVALHMDGIRFALRDTEEGGLQPPNLSFLEILSEFSFKLLRQDRTQLNAFLKGECSSGALSWPSVRMYQRSMTTGATTKSREGGGGDRTTTQSPHSTPRAKRRKTSPNVHTSTFQRMPATSKLGTHTHDTGSDKGSIISEIASDDEFSEGLSLIEEGVDEVEEEEEAPEIEDYESDDSNIGFILPTSRRTSTSYLEDLFP